MLIVFMEAEDMQTLVNYARIEEKAMDDGVFQAASRVQLALDRANKHETFRARIEDAHGKLMEDAPRSLRSLQAMAHEVAVNAGWWERERELPEMLALMHSELSEALEAYRDSGDVEKQWLSSEGKPEGVRYELADAVIRVMDYCERMGWDLETLIHVKSGYNATRERRHGGKAV